MKLGYAIAPKKLVNREECICFLYREEPDNIYDSGWRFFAGNETDEEVNNPDNLAIYDIDTILKFNPEILPLLNSDAGTAFERQSRYSPFQKSVFDIPPE